MSTPPPVPAPAPAGAAHKKAAPPRAKTPYEQWQDTIKDSQSDPRWNDHDKLIQDTVNEFNTRLASTTGFTALNWKLVKAMLWTESGGPTNKAWTTKPLQIGVANDPGLAALLGSTEGGDLILTTEQKALLAKGVSTPAMNVLAAVGYLLMRALKTETRSVNVANDPAIYTVKVKSGDSLDRIARANGTTVDALRAATGGILTVIRPGQELKYRKASMQRVITGWQSIDTGFAAKRYNGGGDLRYKEKLEYCLTFINAARPLAVPTLR